MTFKAVGGRNSSSAVISDFLTKKAESDSYPMRTAAADPRLSPHHHVEVRATAVAFGPLVELL